DRVNDVAENEPGLQEVEMAVTLELVGIVEPPIQPGGERGAAPKRPLIGKVVDGEQRPDILVPRLQRGVGIPVVLFAQVNRDEAGLPVVGMDDIGPEIEEADGLEHGATEEDEALIVVRVIAARSIRAKEAVETAAKAGMIAVEKLRLIDEV